MSPKAFEPETSSEVRVRPVTPEVSQPPVAPSAPPTPAPTVTLVAAPQVDIYVRELMESQPATLEAAVSIAAPTTKQESRLSLPEFFEQFAYDCSRGNACRYHEWEEKEVFYVDGGSLIQYHQRSRGPYVFRWIWKDKRSIDYYMGAIGWMFVNQRYFPDSPRYLFSANGGVEKGDLLLCFLPAKRALEIREQPGKLSTELLRSRISKSRTNPREALMSTPDNPDHYMPDLSKESSEADVVPGSGDLVEGRDFE